MSQYPYAIPPFRKRRPVLFIFLALCALCLAFALVTGIVRAIDRSGIFSGPRLGLVRIEGFIGDAERVIAWAEELRRDATVAGVLVRIDSPGGAVAPSQELHAAIRRLAGEKPVVVSMGAVAASGGYYAAVAGREIFANPSTLTGSIGVRLQVTNVQGLMERLGVASESLVTGRLKAAGSPFQPLTAEERDYLQNILADMQDEFLAAVATGRSLPKETVAAVADGRVLTGRQALEAKLVDHLGDQQAAFARLQELCGLKGEPAVLDGPEKSTPWWKTLIETVIELDAAKSAGLMHGVTRHTFCYY